MRLPQFTAVCSILCSGFLAVHGHAQVVYSEDFSAPSARSSTNGIFALGGSSGAAALSLGEWAYYASNGGIGQAPTGDGSGVGSTNTLSSVGLARPMDWRGTNARAIAVFLDPALFTSTGAGAYTITFDLLGDAGGNVPDATRVFIDLVSGYDLSGSTSAAVQVDVTQNGWGDISKTAGTSPFTALGSAVLTPALEAGFSATADTSITFYFNYDGSSAVAFAAATYNNTYGIDNFTVERATDASVNSFWFDSPAYGGHWRFTAKGYPGEPGIGWIWDGAWPAVYAYGLEGDASQGNWMYVLADAGSRDGFYAWVWSGDSGYWIYGSSAWGWYYSFKPGSEGWVPFAG